MLKDKSTKNYKTWGKEEYIKLSSRNPQNFLAKANPDFCIKWGIISV